jgi:SNF2 family DNA or RNA helicase
MVYKLIAANTIEEKIVELQKNEQNLADNLLQATSQKYFNSSDLNSLLQLLEIDI